MLKEDDTNNNDKPKQGRDDTWYGSLKEDNMF